MIASEKNDVMLTISELERLTGHTYRTLKRRLSNLDPIKGEQQKQLYRLSEILKSFLGADQFNQDKLELTQERAALAKAQAAKVRFDLELAQGKYVKIEEIEKEWDQLVLAIRGKFLALPFKLAPQLENVAAFDAEEFLKDSIHEILQELADAKGNLEGEGIIKASPSSQAYDQRVG
ncbi:MAG: hypothetical protein HYW48_09275 [Deltaproteobacteria bacterium]|nr:hypothetical protein [Deltaproteobacteria bacterium]